MIQEIEPKIFANDFKPRKPKKEDFVFVFQRNQPLFIKCEEERRVPTFGWLQEHFPQLTEEIIYLFSIDDCGFYLLKNDQESLVIENESLVYEDVRTFRTYEPMWIGFAGVTASHLAKWYQSNKFCGCCGSKMEPSKTERAMTCKECGFIDYPKICPVIIVGVTNGDKILMTRYANRSFKRYALIAGFCEIGESLEETIRREVLEEVGVKVKNAKYYKSQPWGFSESLLMGFFAELDGEDTVTLDTEELAEGAWFHRDEIPEDEENRLSLTYTMMKAFKEREV